jgi:hypothetical protein
MNAQPSLAWQLPRHCCQQLQPRIATQQPRWSTRATPIGQGGAQAGHQLEGACLHTCGSRAASVAS